MMLDDAGAFAVSASCAPALAGAVLAELALAGAIEIETEGGLWKRTRVAVDNPAAVTDPVLTEALEDIATKKRSPQDLVTRLGKQVPEKLCNRLVERGLVEGEEPEARIATVIAILAAADVLHKVVDRGPLSKRDLKKRVEEIADGGWATEAVRKSIQAAQAAVMAGVTAATVAGASACS